MLNTTLDRCSGNAGVHFPGADVDELRIPHRNRAVAEIDPDRALPEAVGRALCATGYPALRGVQIEIDRGIVVLWGRVPTYYQKQLAQVTAHQVEGVRGIANGIEVVCRR